jgi:hypothetical protein
MSDDYNLPPGLAKLAQTFREVGHAVVTATPLRRQPKPGKLTGYGVQSAKERQRRASENMRYQQLKAAGVQHRMPRGLPPYQRKLHREQMEADARRRESEAGARVVDEDGRDWGAA